MGLITVSGEPGCRYEEVARVAAQKLGFELVTEPRLADLIERDFGGGLSRLGSAQAVGVGEPLAGQPTTPEPPRNGAQICDKAYRHLLLAILARLATQHHLVVCACGVEHLFRNFLGVLRVRVLASESRRIGTLMLDRRLDRASAKQLLRRMEAEERAARKRKFGRALAPPEFFDLSLNAELFDTEQMVELIEAAVRVKGLVEQGLLSAAADAQLQFQARLQLSRYGIVPAGAINLKRNSFSHPSEEIFANLLDFYRIAWEFEPHSFPIQWDKDGRVLEAFTPDFYLPEFDLYVELTTMKQPLVTRKNRKVKLLREIYPHIQIQVFYQKDFQNLIFKYGLTERLARA